MCEVQGPHSLGEDRGVGWTHLLCYHAGRRAQAWGVRAHKQGDGIGISRDHPGPVEGESLGAGHEMEKGALTDAWVPRGSVVVPSDGTAPSCRCKTEQKRGLKGRGKDKVQVFGLCEGAARVVLGHKVLEPPDSSPSSAGRTRVVRCWRQSSMATWAARARTLP